MKKIILGLLAIALSFASDAQDVNVIGFDGEVHTGGSTISKVVQFPASAASYESILMNVSLGCPAGGCDPWDRYAELRVITESGADIEIGRFVTPYGNDNCGWTIDVSDYREYLQGNTEIISHIETWNNGWEIYTDFEFVEGIPQYEYVTVRQLMKDNQFTYGDTIFYSINLPDFDFDIPANAEEVIFRVINTGHGQGNTQNAAEFSQMTHSIHVNGNEEFTQFLWKEDCNVNPCSPQGGTWEFNRAGWCPGQNVEPWDYNITSFSPAGGSVNVDYVLEPFFNQCSPWNPSCNSSVCSECTYNSNTHTEPVYKVALQMIIKSSTPLPLGVYDIEQALGLSLYPNPSTGLVNIEMSKPVMVRMRVMDITGKEVLEQVITERFSQIDLSEKQAGVYLIQLENDKGALTEKVILNK